MAITYPDAAFLGTLLSQLFLGIYITVFGLYVQIVRRRKTPLGLVDYGLIALFVLCFVTIVLDALQQFFTLMRGGAPWIPEINAATSTMSITLDFISQLILIFRCWNVWGRVIWVGAIPSVIALASYVTGMCVTVDLATVANAYEEIPVYKGWWVPLGVTSMALSLAVNTLVSGLMISRILYVYRQTQRAVGNSTSNRLSWVASVMLESALALFVAQLVYLVLYKIEHPAFSLVAGPVTIIYGLNCTAIMVRVGMNHSFETMATSHHSSIVFRGEKSAPFISENSGDATTTQISSVGEDKPRHRHLNETETTIVHV